jgi:hypothetical protein
MKYTVACSGNVETIASCDSCWSALISYEGQFPHSLSKIFVQDVTERIILSVKQKMPCMILSYH